MDRIRPQQTPGMRWAGKSTSLGHKPPVFCNRTARCYEQMEKTGQARRLQEDPRLGAGAEIQAAVEYSQKAAALDERLLAFDWTEVIVYIRHFLAPQLRPGDMVIWDNVPTHKSANVLTLIEATVARV